MPAAVALEVQVAVFGLETSGETMKTQKVAFVCLHGSAKSLIAAEYFNRLAREKSLPVRATASGSEPDAEVPAHVVEGMKTRGIDVQAYRPTLTAAAQLDDADLIVSFASDAGRRLAPGKPEERWDECPAVIDSFDIAWDFIAKRVDALVENIDSK
jgi:protein-tyrosine-phosphatase